MDIIIYIILGIIGLYLLLVIPAGIGVLIAEVRFRKSPYREHIEEIINHWKQRLQQFNESDFIDLCDNPKREMVEKDGIEFSISLQARKIKINKSFEVIISIGKLKPITFGHAEKFVIKPNKIAS
ncbi:MAG: hypothetical protein P8Y77_01335 [Nitrospirota bacterium]|jgi:hypothetical protein